MGDDEKEEFWKDDEAGPHHHDAEFAERAAAESAGKGSGQMKGRIMTLLRDAEDGLTDWELNDALEQLLQRRVAHTGTVAWRNRLMGAGWVLPTGRHRTGPFGKANEIWIAIPEGEQPVPVPAGLKRPPLEKTA